MSITVMFMVAASVASLFVERVSTTIMDREFVVRPILHAVLGNVGILARLAVKMVSNWFAVLANVGTRVEEVV